MKINILSKDNSSKKTLDLPQDVVKAVNHRVVSEYINHVRNVERSAIANTKDRSEVSGGGKKPWKQKGTGRARHGSNRSPLWVGGGVTFGPSSCRNFKSNHPKSFKKYARNAVLNYLAVNGKLAVISEDLSTIKKTKDADRVLSEYKLEGKMVLIVSEKELADTISFRNLSYMHIVTKNCQNIVDMISSDIVLFTTEGYKEYFSKSDFTKEKIETDN